MSLPRFTLADLERANSEWGCNCGPASLAAVSNLTLEEVRPHFQTFKGWTNPSQMIAAVDRVCQSRRSWTPTRDGHGIDWPRYGLALIQWEGPWTAPVPASRAKWAWRDRARRTHWVGVAALSSGSPIVFDSNAMDVNGGWAPLAYWTARVVPALTADIKRASGGWHVTHAIEVARP